MAQGKKTGGRRKGTPNKRTAALKAAAAATIERFEQDMPAAFDGDGVAFLQTIYRNPSLELSMRIDAAAKAARYERPTTTNVRNVTSLADLSDEELAAIKADALRRERDETRH